MIYLKKTASRASAVERNGAGPGSMMPPQSRRPCRLGSAPVTLGPGGEEGGRGTYQIYDGDADTDNNGDAERQVTFIMISSAHRRGVPWLIAAND